MIKYIKVDDLKKHARLVRVSKLEMKNAVLLEDLNQIESETQLGYWEPIPPVIYEKSKYYKCSECGAVSDSNTAYCPHCGAKMVEYPESGEGDRL